MLNSIFGPPSSPDDSGKGNNNNNKINNAASYSSSSSPSSNSNGGGDNYNNDGNNRNAAENAGIPQDYYRFDPSGLERGAKAVRELDSSKNSEKAYELAKESEKTKQLEFSLQKSQIDAQRSQFDAQRSQKEMEQKMKMMQIEAENRKKMVEYKNQLDKRNQIDLMNAQKQQKAEDLKRQEESIARQEAMKRKTIDYEAKLKRETEIAKVKAEMQGKIRREKENHKLHKEMARLEASERRKTILESITLAGSTIGSGIMMFLGDKERLQSSGMWIAGIALSIYTAKVATGVSGRYIEARLGKPSLVRETSKISVFESFRSPIRSFRKYRAKQNSNVENVLDGIILSPNLEARMRSIAFSTANTKLNSAPFRNLLLFGPPGTGKTMYAKALAAHSGMEYAIMTGGDVAPLGPAAVTEIHKLFDWASHSRKGLLVFIDEADAFLQKRSTNDRLSTDMRNALNAFLYRTGEASDKFMVVFSSNQPDQFDWAVNDRIDEMVEFDLPNDLERLTMLQHYFIKYIKDTKINIDGVDESVFEEITSKTKDFSGREISKLAVAWQAAAYGHPEVKLTSEMMVQALENFLQAHRQKMQWASDQKLKEYSAGL